MKWIRKTYDWVISLADKPFGESALFLLAFAEASFFPIPPDPLLIALILGNQKKSLRLASICTLGSVLGGMAGYLIGYKLWNLTSSFFYQYIPGFSPQIFENMQGHYDRWSFWIVFTAGFTPIPYKIFTISSGLFSINIWGFGIASLTGRAARFFLIGGLVGKYGTKINAFIDKYFNLLTVLFVVLLICGFLIAKLMF